MSQGETEEQGVVHETCRALVVVHSQDSTEEPARRISAGRPMAGFLAQLIVDTDPALRVARSERTRGAAALYARARSEENKAELQSLAHFGCRLLLEKKKLHKIPALLRAATEYSLS